MNIKNLETKIICQNKDSFHNYFGWPSVARLQNGRLAMVASGFRLQHVCPFGKVIMCFSEDEGKTWSAPSVIIDTPLDDRDAGICTFGEGGVVITSFNNSTNAQRFYLEKYFPNPEKNDYIVEYLKLVDKTGVEGKYIGSTYKMSYDCGKTWGDVKRIPISSPHGPCIMPDGNMLYVGTNFTTDWDKSDKTGISSYLLRQDGTYEKLGDIEVDTSLNFCEPHAIVLDSGKIVVHIRVGGRSADKSIIYFTTYQTESYDGGRTFTKPYQLLSEQGGATAHLMKHSSGVLISTYEHRIGAPYGIKAMFSTDEGETWDKDNFIFENHNSEDLGYPSSVELADGKILTVFYAHPEKGAPAVIMQTIWEIEG